MRPLAYASLWLLLAAGGPLAATPAQSAAPAAEIVVAFANEPAASPGPAGTTGSRYGGSGYRVGQSAERQARNVAAAYALREVHSWPIQVLSMHCVVFEIANGRKVDEVVAALSRDSRVLLAQPLHEFRTLGAAGTTSAGAARAEAPPTEMAVAPAAASYNDPLFDLQTNMAALGIARAHARTQGAGVRIALIDTGVDLAHPDLRGASIHSRSFLDSPGRPAALRHGTAMAGVIAAVANNHIGIVGIAPRAELEVYEACWQLAPAADAAACNTFTLARALAAALASQAQLVNLSFAGPADPLLTALVQTGLKRGVTFVGAAAGPDAPFPTAIPGVITAAGSEQAAPADALAAPSQHVMSLRPQGEYDFESGSSVAAAEVTSVMALLLSASPRRLSTSTLLSLLTVTRPVQSLAQAPVAPVDVNTALSRLDALTGGASITARAAPR
ncbi:MAG: S8 family serine peptidase [Gammaproteobacteria bacterium]|nr:S8 family serine peptidase [Gammaproteobacteria bacterium]